MECKITDTVDYDNDTQAVVLTKFYDQSCTIIINKVLHH